jgi:hypothetical protein
MERSTDDMDWGVPILVVHDPWIMMMVVVVVVVVAHYVLCLSQTGNANVQRTYQSQPRSTET